MYLGWTLDGGQLPSTGLPPAWVFCTVANPLAVPPRRCISVWCCGPSVSSPKRAGGFLMRAWASGLPERLSCSAMVMGLPPTPPRHPRTQKKKKLARKILALQCHPHAHAHAFFAGPGWAHATSHSHAHEHARVFHAPRRPGAPPLASVGIPFFSHA
jgi:hypothetical protein